LRRFQPKYAPEAFGGQSSPGPTGGNLQRSSRPPIWIKTGDRDKGRRKGKRQEGIDSSGRETEEAGKGRQGKRDGKEWKENGRRNLAGASNSHSR